MVLAELNLLGLVDLPYFDVKESIGKGIGRNYYRDSKRRDPKLLMVIHQNGLSKKAIMRL